MQNTNVNNFLILIDNYSTYENKSLNFKLFTLPKNHMQ